MIDALLKLDLELSNRMRLEENRTLLRRAAAFFAHSGDSWFWLAGLLIIWMFTVGIWHQRAALMAGAIVIQAVTVIIIKFIIRRRRPEGEWGEIYRKTDPHSFPSGHAVRAVMLVVMAWGLEISPLNWILLFWAPLVSYARIALGLHYVIDVVFGWLMGVILAVLMLHMSPLFMQWFSWVF